MYEKEHGSPVPYNSIPESARVEVLQRIRARELRIEQFVTHDMLIEKVSEQRFTPRRKMRVMAGILIVMLLIIGAVEALIPAMRR